MPAARARECLTSRELYIDPIVSLDIEDCDFVCASALTKATEYYHLSAILFDNSRVLISVRHGITSGFDLGPTHGLEVKIVQLADVSRLVSFELCRFVVVAAEEVHVVLEDN